MKTSRYFVFICIPVICEAGNTLTMHVFDENEHVESGLNNIALINENTQNSMEMVVFANNEPSRIDSYEPPQEMPVSPQSRNDFTFDYEITSGYQYDKLDWQVSGSSDVTKWQSDSATIGTSFDIDTPVNVVFKGGGSYAWTLDGGQDIPNLMTGAKQISNASNGYGWNLSLATGYKFKLDSNKKVSFSATPLAGYSWQERKNASDKSEIYLSSWNGPWVGLDVEMTMLQKHQLFSEGQYHWANYKANNNTNLTILSPQSVFTHNGNATGWLASAGYRYKLNKQFAIKIAADYQKWQIDNATQKVGSTDNAVKINRESLGVNVGVNYSF